MPLPAPKAHARGREPRRRPARRRTARRWSTSASRSRPATRLGVIGPSGAGKSSLVRVVIGAWAPARGRIRLDGAALEQWDPDTLGQHIGYLPQDVELFAGTVAENIARFEPDAESEKIVEAAQAAGRARPHPPPARRLFDRRSARAAPRSPPASASASRSPARSMATRSSSSSTSPTPTSTPRATRR